MVRLSRKIVLQEGAKSLLQGWIEGELGFNNGLQNFVTQIKLVSCTHYEQTPYLLKHTTKLYLLFLARFINRTKRNN